VFSWRTRISFRGTRGKNRRGRNGRSRDWVSIAPTENCPIEYSSTGAAFAPCSPSLASQITNREGWEFFERTIEGVGVAHHLRVVLRRTRQLPLPGPEFFQSPFALESPERLPLRLHSLGHLIAIATIAFLAVASTAPKTFVRRFSIRAIRCTRPNLAKDSIA
jgi:hypothetical protein